MGMSNSEKKAFAQKSEEKIGSIFRQGAEEVGQLASKIIPAIIGSNRDLEALSGRINALINDQIKPFTASVQSKYKNPFEIAIEGKTTQVSPVISTISTPGPQAPAPGTTPGAGRGRS